MPPGQINYGNPQQNAYMDWLQKRGGGGASWNSTGADPGSFPFGGKNLNLMFPDQSLPGNQNTYETAAKHSLPSGSLFSPTNFKDWMGQFRTPNWFDRRPDLMMDQNRRSAGQVASGNFGQKPALTYRNVFQDPADKWDWTKKSTGTIGGLPQAPTGTGDTEEWAKQLKEYFDQYNEAAGGEGGAGAGGETTKATNPKWSAWDSQRRDREHEIQQAIETYGADRVTVGKDGTSYVVYNKASGSDMAIQTRKTAIPAEPRKYLESDEVGGGTGGGNADEFAPPNIPPPENAMDMLALAMANPSILYNQYANIANQGIYGPEGLKNVLNPAETAQDRQLMGLQPYMNEQLGIFDKGTKADLTQIAQSGAEQRRRMGTGLERSLGGRAAQQPGAAAMAVNQAAMPMFANQSNLESGARTRRLGQEQALTENMFNTAQGIIGDRGRIRSGLIDRNIQSQAAGLESMSGQGGAMANLMGNRLFDTTDPNARQYQYQSGMAGLGNEYQTQQAAIQQQYYQLNQEQQHKYNMEMQQMMYDMQRRNQGGGLFGDILGGIGGVLGGPFGGALGGALGGIFGGGGGQSQSYNPQSWYAQNPFVFNTGGGG